MCVCRPEIRTPWCPKCPVSAPASTNAQQAQIDAVHLADSAVNLDRLNGLVRYFGEIERKFITADGFEIAFDPEQIRWSDPATGSWTPMAHNQAGFLPVIIGRGIALRPLAIFEVEGEIVAYQHGMTLIVERVGKPFIFGVRVLLEH